MKTQHTPGPWRVQGRPDLKAYPGAYNPNNYVTTDAEMVVRIWTDYTTNEMPKGHSIICEMKDGSAMAANARLISAAPELLEAAKLVAAAESREYFGGLFCIERVHSLEAQISNLRAAIAKATGAEGGEA